MAGLSTGNYIIQTLRTSSPLASEAAARQALDAYAWHRVGQLVTVQYYAGGEVSTLLAIGVKNGNGAGAGPGYYYLFGGLQDVGGFISKVEGDDGNLVMIAPGGELADSGFAPTDLGLWQPGRPYGQTVVLAPDKSLVTAKAVRDAFEQRRFYADNTGGGSQFAKLEVCDFLFPRSADNPAGSHYGSFPPKVTYRLKTHFPFHVDAIHGLDTFVFDTARVKSSKYTQVGDLPLFLLSNTKSDNLGFEDGDGDPMTYTASHDNVTPASITDLCVDYDNADGTGFVTYMANRETRTPVSAIVKDKINGRWWWEWDEGTMPEYMPLPHTEVPSIASIIALAKANSRGGHATPSGAVVFKYMLSGEILMDGHIFSDYPEELIKAGEWEHASVVITFNTGSAGGALVIMTDNIVYSNGCMTIKNWPAHQHGEQPAQGFLPPYYYSANITIGTRTFEEPAITASSYVEVGVGLGRLSLAERHMLKISDNIVRTYLGFSGGGDRYLHFPAVFESYIGRTSDGKPNRNTSMSVRTFGINGSINNIARIDDKAEVTNPPVIIKCSYSEEAGPYFVDVAFRPMSANAHNGSDMLYDDAGAGGQGSAGACSGAADIDIISTDNSVGIEKSTQGGKTTFDLSANAGDTGYVTKSHSVFLDDISKGRVEGSTVGNNSIVLAPNVDGRRSEGTARDSVTIGPLNSNNGIMSAIIGESNTVESGAQFCCVEGLGNTVKEGSNGVFIRGLNNIAKDFGVHIDGDDNDIDSMYSRVLGNGNSIKNGNHHTIIGDNNSIQNNALGNATIFGTVIGNQNQENALAGSLVLGQGNTRNHASNGGLIAGLNNTGNIAKQGGAIIGLGIRDCSVQNGQIIAGTGFNGINNYTIGLVALGFAPNVSDDTLFVAGSGSQTIEFKTNGKFYVNGKELEAMIDEKISEHTAELHDISTLNPETTVALNGETFSIEQIITALKNLGELQYI